MSLRVGWKSVSEECGALCAMTELILMLDLILMPQELCADNWGFKKMVSCHSLIFSYYERSCFSV